MKEEFLHYLWKFRLLNHDLTTRSGEPLTIIHPGVHNPDGGPDFINARIRLDDTTWAGNVEIHVDETDWFGHNHHLDRSYDNVILHVVYNEGKENPEGPCRDLPTLVIKGCYPEDIDKRYQALLSDRSWIPCEKLLPDELAFHFDQWAPSLVIEKLEERSSRWKQLLEVNRHDWAETLHQVMGRSFGLRINTLPFELLAKSLPLRLIRKYNDDLFRIESLAFGQSGLLNREFTDSYPRSLRKEYSFLADKHSLKSIDPSLWKFLRLRPASFPTIRIAQWASFLQNAGRFFTSVLEIRDPGEINELFSADTSKYWESHFIFDKESAVMKKNMGISSVRLHVLNTIAPFLYLYGAIKDLSEYREKAIKLIEQIQGEKNSIVEKWSELGFPVNNALKTQALIRLKTEYCDRKKCLDCRIGARILAGGV